MRTKTVFPTNEIAHLWANQLQTEARNSAHNFYFEGDKIYSYGRHFVIAKHIENKEGVKVVFFTKRTYSNTTAKHIALVRNATNHKNIIYVPDPEQTILSNFEAWAKEAEYIARNLPTARKPEKYLNQIETLKVEATIYAQFLGVKIPKSALIPLNIGSKEEYAKLKEKQDKQAKKDEKQRIKEQAERHAKQLSEFYAFERRTMLLRNTNDYLRYNEGSKRVETSQGIEIPVAIAHKFYKTILATNKKGGCTNCDSKLMDYQVKTINSEFIEIGCHNVTMQEINKIAELLKW